MKFNLDHFLQFCSVLKIDSKEEGLVPLRLKPSQRYFIERMAKGLNEGKHFFVILKARQLGLSTIGLALDLYWSFMNPGMQASLITDSDENRDMFRATLANYVDNLPRTHRASLKMNNRTQMEFENRSRLVFQVAGKRRNGGLGRGKAITFLHATELSSWGDQEGLASLLASLAEHNPKRLFIFESTARGFNLFYDMWERAENSVTQEAVFIGWWHNYSVKTDSPQFKVYGTDKPTPEEKQLMNAVQKRYGHEITMEQLAWWRWKAEEDIGDVDMMMQEYPWLPEQAFIMTGSSFFRADTITDAYKIARVTKPAHYTYHLGKYFDETAISECTKAGAMLTIWEPPEDGAYYVIGADPAYGASEWADRFAIQVLKCYADRVEHVAEFCSPAILPYQFAWIVAHLGGAYKNAFVNLELNGPGMAVFNELDNIKRFAVVNPNIDGGLANVVGSIQYYMWRRPDSLHGGVGAYHWKTTFDTKNLMMNTMNDMFEKGVLKIKSTGTLDEMRYIISDGGDIRAEGRGKDDRTIAMALACMAYQDWVRGDLISQNYTYDVAMTRKMSKNQLPSDVLSNQIQSHFRSIGFSRDH